MVTIDFFAQFLYPEVAKTVCILILIVVYPIHRLIMLVPLLKLHVWEPPTGYELASGRISRDNAFNEPYNGKFSNIAYFVILKNGKSFHLPCHASNKGCFLYTPCDIEVACVDHNNDMCTLASFYNQEARATDFVAVILRLVGGGIQVLTPSEKKYDFMKLNNIKKSVG